MKDKKSLHLTILTAIMLASPALFGADRFHLVDIGDFAAPMVANRTQITNQVPFGTIVFDTFTLSFQGLDNTGNWVPLGTSSTAVRSEVAIKSANGYGSTSGNKIRRWTTPYVNSGSAITYADSATNGATFTINQDGVYSVTYCDQFTSASFIAITLNDTQLTTGASSMTGNEHFSGVSTPNTNGVSCTFATAWMSSGDVVRAHSDGVASGVNTSLERFRIVDVSN